MHAAVVRSFDHPPRYEQWEAPEPSSPNEVLVDVLAAGLHPRVRSGASGKHYTSSGTLPLVPGVDGVGRLPDGQRVYFLALDSEHGTMTERTVVDRARCIPLPDSVADATVAAAMNPAMSSWVGLRLRAQLEPGQNVLVLGATGNAGQMAVQIAKRLGAGSVIGVGRDPQRLTALRNSGADAVVALAGDEDRVLSALGAAASDVDVVVDYLWGRPSEMTMTALLRHRTAPDRRLTWVEIGAIAGPDLTLPSVALRSNNLRILGSGQGSVSVAEILAQMPSLLSELASGSLAVNAREIPLARVEEAWDAPTAPGERVVFLPAGHGRPA
jgi:NADPH:quinone reductase-like Zn-dependent oxidoreductase